MKKVLVFTRYTRVGASSRLRFLQYIEFLDNKDYVFEVSPFFDDDYLNRIARGERKSNLRILFYFVRRFFVFLKSFFYDVIWVEKEVFPVLPAFAEILYKKFGVKYIVDYDDAVFHNYDASKKWIVRKILGRKISKVMRYAACVIVGNDYLYTYAKKAGAIEIIRIPTVVDHNKYFLKKFESKKVITIGWIGSPSTQKYLLEIKSSLLALKKEFDFELLLIGANTDIHSDLSDIKVNFIPWNEEDEVFWILNMDIGIMPLIDGFWEKGKCGYKLVQYMACGIPVVASPVGVNIEIVNFSKSGFLAEDNNEWFRFLKILIADYEVRKELGMNGRKAVEEKYSIAANIGYIKDILSRK